jgi:pimeloyl-ACP methyl ester carboxylesterase
MPPFKGGHQLIWLKWSAFGLFGLAVLALLILVASALLSLDWRKKHSQSSAALDPLRIASEQPDGLTLIQVGDLDFRARVANLGGTGDAIILLHGFPQTSISWQPLIKAAAAGGYRALAFDQRGYSPGARPANIDAYSKKELVADVIGVADAAGFKRFHLVGHDWGSAVAWSVLMANPERVLSLSSLSIPHPLAFGEAVKTDPDQRKRSRYIAFFRLPWLPELLLSANKRYLLRSIIYRWLPAEQAEEYLRVFAEPGALTGALNWYRALFKDDLPPWNANVSKPILQIWGNRDPAVGRKAIELQEQYIHASYTNLELDAEHWLLETRTKIIVRNVLKHIASSSTKTRDSLLI